MFGTNKLCMKGIYLPTWHYFTGEQRLQKIYTYRQPLERKTCFITCVFIYIIYRFNTIILLEKTSRYCDVTYQLNYIIFEVHIHKFWFK
jgi:hypothetical protein